MRGLAKTDLVQAPKVVGARGVAAGAHAPGYDI